jgi:putative membrane protein
VRRNANFENNDEMIMIKRLFLLWIATTAALWVADGVFDSVRFKTLESLILSGFLLALVNQTVKPLLLLVTLPITVLSFGFALPVINGLVLLAIAGLVKDFEIDGFWMSVVCALLVSVVSFLIGLATGNTVVRGQLRAGPGARRRAENDTDPNVIDVEVRERDSDRERLR